MIAPCVPRPGSHLLPRPIPLPPFRVPGSCAGSLARHQDGTAGRFGDHNGLVLDDGPVRPSFVGVHGGAQAMKLPVNLGESSSNVLQDRQSELPRLDRIPKDLDPGHGLPPQLQRIEKR